jgi:hypothetical protein
MTDRKYSYESLQKFCNQNGIELCRDYSTEKVRRETKIEGKCKTDGCDGVFNKSFRELLENGGYFCKPCFNKISSNKRKNSCLEKYGVENVVNCDIVQTKMKETNLKKYGTEHTFQSEQIKYKIKQTLIERYGVDNPNKNTEIRNKGKQTCLERYGAEHILQTEQYKEKYKTTIFEKYGVENISQNENIKQKKINTCLINYGVEYPPQSEVIKQLKIKTSLKKYGVEYPIQYPKVLDRNIKSCYRTKEYVMPSGNTLFTQGYEYLALDELINKQQIDENNIIMGSKNVPTIWYIGNDGKNHRHYVDIFIPTENRCIEVKSSWTAKKNEHNIYLKQQSAKQLGYNYEIWIYNEKKQLVNLIK